MQQLIEEFQKYQTTRGHRPRTVRDYKYVLGYFFRFLEQKGITDLKEVKRENILDYQQYLYHELKKQNGERLNLKTQAALICVLNPFFTYLVIANHVMYNPTNGINKPRIPKRIPRDILSEKEMKLLLSMPDLNTTEGYRDRVLLEVFYSTGIRANEARFIKLNDVDLINRELFIRDGKGGKDRLVPLTKSCARYLEIYIANHIKVLLNGRTSEYLFIGVNGKVFHAHAVRLIVHKYVTEAKFKQRITSHSLRHTCATHLLKKGASIRLIQVLLGHNSLNTTEQYTRIDIGDLKKALDIYHPRGGL